MGTNDDGPACLDDGDDHVDVRNVEIRKLKKYYEPPPCSD